MPAIKVGLGFGGCFFNYVNGEFMEREYYIDYLCKDKGFRETRKWFATEDEAWQWALKNLSNPNRDQIRMKRPSEWAERL